MRTITTMIDLAKYPHIYSKMLQIGLIAIHFNLILVIIKLIWGCQGRHMYGNKNWQVSPAHKQKNNMSKQQIVGENIDVWKTANLNLFLDNYFQKCSERSQGEHTRNRLSRQEWRKDARRKQTSIKIWPGIFTIWHIYQWHFYHLAFLPMSFLPSGIFTNDIFTFWHIYLWHFHHIAFLPMAFLPMTILPMAFYQWHFYRTPASCPSWSLTRDCGRHKLTLGRGCLMIW